ncbi:PREDICTED: cytosolic carboxypeptidase 6-like [Mandrillus leucophaeus]|uniref:cytosolic carboxypeptidase 6-like n=1 Tax=Mandrillus leucophaeus TaxID=9568 RepID=UPI0005F4AEB1|nr:PREDICTED: cytosolic carboxypeptidase 6-like [Mandrillus leucophaeus]
MKLTLPQEVCAFTITNRYQKDSLLEEFQGASSFHSVSISFQSCSLTHTPADMKLGRNVARTFLDYYRLNPMVEKVAIPMPRLRKEKSPPYKHPLLRGPASNYPNGKGDKKSSVNHKDPSTPF